jgi:hypothetical protein
VAAKIPINVKTDLKIKFGSSENLKNIIENITPKYIATYKIVQFLKFFKKSKLTA